MENGLFLCKNMDSLRREGNTFFSGQIPLFTCFLHDYFRFKAQFLLPLKSSAFLIHSVVDYTIKYLQISAERMPQMQISVGRYLTDTGNDILRSNIRRYG